MTTATAAKPAPLTLASVLPWVRKCFLLNTNADRGLGGDPSAISHAACRSCKAYVEPTADALASHECGGEASPTNFFAITIEDRAIGFACSSEDIADARLVRCSEKAWTMGPLDPDGLWWDEPTKTLRHDSERIAS